MCGITGLVNLNGERVSPETMISSAKRLERRGPDHAGVWVENNVGLGHRRLSIIDLSPAGNQPMSSANGRYVIVYNGEVYNFKEIRAELSAKGHAWRGNNDTEVILAAYAEWGAACLSRFQGMFSFAIWDKQEKTLFAARDRMGVKPFYYSAAPGYFAFASRPGALFRLKKIDKEIDPQGLRLYLESGYFPAPYYIYKGIRKLPPAHFLTIKNGVLEIKRYWDFCSIPVERAWEKRPEGDLLDELDEIILNCVKSRMISDVPLGAFLSGGIDSSLVVAVMRKVSNAPVKTFTIGFKEKECDESAYAQRVAEYLSTDHTCEYISTRDLLDLMPLFSAQYDEPFFDNSAFATMAVSRLARRQVTVSLSGDGGDELFGGYHYYNIIKHLGLFFKLPAGVRKISSYATGLMPHHKLKLLSAAMGQRDVAAAFAFSRSIAKDFRGVVPNHIEAETFSLRQHFSEGAKHFPANLLPEEAGMRLDAANVLPEDYLQKVDVASMAFSLESRDPLLDHKLVEWAMRLPVCWKLRDGRNKYLLRQLAYRYVPREILDRPKQGFGMPIDSWLRGPLKNWALERLGNKKSFASLPLDHDAVMRLWHMHESGTRNAHPLIWAILMLLDFCGQPDQENESIN